MLHSINGAGPTVISEFSYDAVGRMIGHSLGQYNLFSHFYNIRGWNTATTSRHWRQNLEYSPGGRIAAQQWWCWGPDDRTRRYDYRYDSASQLVAAAYSDNGRSYQIFSTEYSYDLNGNPLTIRREGKVGENFYQCVDDITLTYDGNRLVRASDAGFEPYFQGARHFIDGADLDTEYTYDALGRTLTDANKGITATVYDFNSRPRSMTFDGGNRTEWLYDAAATLLRTTHTVAMTSPSVPGMASADSTEYVSTVTDRLGDLIIEDGAVSRIVTDNGFALPDGAAFDYCFYVTDHQGNNRMVIDADGTVHRIEHYYPFGLSFEVTNFTSRGTTSRRSFGGKEFDRTSGLDLYDQEARQYDPALLRFTRPDDLGDKYLPLSPFAFCLNNPVLFTDPSGQNPVFDEFGYFLGCTSEGYSGEVMIYTGDDYLFNFSKYNLSETKRILGNQLISFDAYNRSGKMSNDAKSRIWNHIVAHFEGLSIFGKRFFLRTIEIGQIGFNEELEKDTNWLTVFGRISGIIFKIIGAGNYDYETTVENIASSLIVHEWFSHGIQHYCDEDKTHHRAYLNVINYKIFWNRTTPKYKLFNLYNFYNYLDKEVRIQELNKPE